MKKNYLIYGSAAVLLIAAAVILIFAPGKYFENHYPDVDNQLHTVLRDQISDMKRDSGLLSDDIHKLRALNSRRAQCCAQLLSINYDDKGIEAVFPESDDPLTSYDQYQAERNIRSKFFSPLNRVLEGQGFGTAADWFVLFEDQGTRGLELFEKNLEDLNDNFSEILGENDNEEDFSPDDYFDSEPKSVVIDELSTKYNLGAFNEKKQSLIAALSDSSAVLSDIRKQGLAVIEKYKAIHQLKRSYEELAATSKDSALLKVALPIFGLIIISLLLIPLLFASREKADPNKSTDADGVIRNIFANKLILEIFTVFILTITILILGIGDKLSPEVLGTLLGGISIYVLQKTLGQSAPASTGNPPIPCCRQTNVGPNLLGPQPGSGTANNSSNQNAKVISSNHPPITQKPMAANVKVTVLLNEAVNELDYGIFCFNFPITFEQDPGNPKLLVGKLNQIVFTRPFLELMVHGQNGFTCEVNVFINDVKFNSKPILVEVREGNGHYNDYIS